MSDSPQMADSKYTFKFRAECILDVFTWLFLCGRECPHTYTIVKPDTCPDVEVEYTTPIEGGLVEAMYRVSDGHVMIESHAPVDEYTGDRVQRDYPVLEPAVLADLVAGL